MTKILEEVRQISSDAVAKKQDSAKNKLPKLIQQIKGAATLGKTQCEFVEYEIDEYSKKLLELEGFRVYATTETRKDYKDYLPSQRFNTIWVVSW